MFTSNSLVLNYIIPAYVLKHKEMLSKHVSDTMIVTFSWYDNGVIYKLIYFCIHANDKLKSWTNLLLNQKI